MSSQDPEWPDMPHPADETVPVPPYRPSSNPSDVPPGWVDVTGSHEDPKQIGPYRLLQQIGEGGFGVVYMAEQMRPVRRKVALKVLKPGMDSREVVVRFEAERQALSMMSHPNIATVLDAGTTDGGHPYFAMELVKGIPITEYCDNGRLSTHERLKLVCEVCRAVQHAHHKGIIHRDIKPSNILVTLHGEIPVAKIIDFGIAKAINQPLTEKTLFTRYGQMVGTPAYMSPEQADLSGLDIDTRSDVYSLGVLLYELLTGTTPLRSDRLQSIGFVEIQRIICQEEPPTPSTRVRSLGDDLAAIATRRRTEPSRLRQLLRRELDWIVMRALEKDRARRYQSASAMAADIERYLANETVEACPPTTRYRIQKFVRKYRISLSVGATVILILAAATTVSVWQAITANEEKDRAVLLAARLDEARAVAEKLAGQTSESARIARRSEQIAIAQAVETERQRLAAEDARRKLREQLYVADMNRVGQAYEDGSMQQVVQFLNAHRPVPGEPDLRGFEWYYWWRASHLDVGRYRESAAPYNAMVAPTDGRWVAALAFPGTVRILDPVRMKATQRLDTSMEAFWGCLSPDGAILAVAGYGDRIRLFKTSDWTMMRDLQLSLSQFTVMEFSPTASTMASGGKNQGTITLWDTETWEPAAYAIEEFSLGSNVAFSRDGRQLALGSGQGDFSIVIWDVAAKTTGKRLLGHEAGVISVAWSPDGRLLASGSSDETIRLWSRDLEKVEVLRALGPAELLAFSSDGKYLAAAVNRHNAVRVWSTESGGLLCTIKGHGQPVNGLAFVGGTTTLWTASEDGYLKTWDIHRADRTEILTVAPGTDTSSLVGLTSLSQDRVFLTHVPGQAILCWGLDAPVSPGPSPWGGGEKYALAALSEDARFLASLTLDGVVQVWDLRLDRRAAEERIEPALRGNPVKMSVSRNGRIVVLRSDTDPGGQLTVVDLTTGELRRRHFDGLAGAVLSADGKKALIVPNIFSAQLWDLDRDEIEATFSSVGPVRSLVFSPDGKYLAIGYWGNNINVHSVQTHDRIHFLEGHAGEVTSLAFSPDSATLVSGSMDGSLKLWSLDSGALLGTLTGHRGSVTWARFAPDGYSILSASTEDDEVKIWRRATEAEEAGDVRDAVELLKNADGSRGGQREGLQVLSMLNEALDLRPNDAQLLMWRGDALTELGRPFEALVDYRRAVELGVEEVQPIRRYLELRGLSPWISGSDQGELTWRFTMEEPADDQSWKTRTFDDTGWQAGVGPFGTGRARTRWARSDIWLRHEFELKDAEGLPLAFLASVDDVAEIYLNGVLASLASLQVGVGGDEYQRLDCADSAYQTLRRGKNVIAIHCRNTGGGARLDVELCTSIPGETAEAFLNRLLEARPESSDLIEVRVTARARSGDWSGAARDYLSLVQLHQSSGEMWMQAATLFAWAGEVPRYREVAQEMYERFKDGDQAADLEKLAKTCLMVTPLESVLGSVTTIAYRANRIASGGGDQAWVLPYTQLVVGWAEFRGGNHGEAITWCEKALAHDRIPVREAQTHFILAMSYFHAKEPDKARRALEDGERILEGRRIPTILNRGVNWHDWIICELLLREAQELLQR